MKRIVFVAGVSIIAALFAGCGPIEATWESSDEAQFLVICQQAMKSFSNVSSQQAVSFCRCHLKELKANGFTSDDVAEERTPKSLLSKCEEYAGIS
jgi:hypothetical protein